MPFIADVHLHYPCRPRIILCAPFRSDLYILYSAVLTLDPQRDQRRPRRRRRRSPTLRTLSRRPYNLVNTARRPCYLSSNAKANTNANSVRIVSYRFVSCSYRLVPSFCVISFPSFVPSSSSSCFVRIRILLRSPPFSLPFPFSFSCPLKSCIACYYLCCCCTLDFCPFRSRFLDPNLCSVPFPLSYPLHALTSLHSSLSRLVDRARRRRRLLLLLSSHLQSSSPWYRAVQVRLSWPSFIRLRSLVFVSFFVCWFVRFGFFLCSFASVCTYSFHRFACVRICIRIRIAHLTPFLFLSSFIVRVAPHVSLPFVRRSRLPRSDFTVPHSRLPLSPLISIRVLR